MADYTNLKKLIDNSSNIVFFGGAGTSTESNIPDFRSAKGLYSENYGLVPPERILSASFFREDPDLFYSFMRDKIYCPDAQPNKAHLALAKLEEMGKLKAVITQNIDGLHQKAGSKNVLELHGAIQIHYCTNCDRSYSLEEVLPKDNVPLCDDCGHIIKPDVVLYEEALNHRTMEKAVNAIIKADLLIVGGTSLTVYPAAGFIEYFRGDHLVLINKSSTAYDRRANLIISDAIGEVLGKVILND